MFYKSQVFLKQTTIQKCGPEVGQTGTENIQARIHILKSWIWDQYIPENMKWIRCMFENI